MKPAGEVPLLSVLVPAYGVAHLVGDALRSLQAQSRGDWEAIVIDDGAPDDVEGALRPFAEDHRVRFLKTENGGLSVARNRAAAAARAPWVSLLDGDDVYEPHYVASMLAQGERDPTIGFLTCDATYFGDDRQGRRFSSYHSQSTPLTLRAVVRRDFNVFVGCMIRRDAFVSVGGFDPSLRSVEDLDLWMRLLAAGYRGALLPEALVRYRRRVGSLSSDSRSMTAATRHVYAKLVATLGDRPEREDAQRILTQLEREQIWQDGEDQILAGNIRQGLTLMKGAEQRSLRWQIAMPMMRLFPALAKPILRARASLPEPRAAVRPPKSCSNG
jgi:glycosyltransferase involved in cell wall biosynthesis